MSTVSGIMEIGQILYLALLRPVSIMPDTVIWAPDDGWRCHPKHEERFADINKLYIVASCWIIIDILNDARTTKHKYSDTSANE